MPGTGKGFPPEARLNGDEARAGREKIRSIGHGSALDDYIFEWDWSVIAAGGVRDLN